MAMKVSRAHEQGEVIYTKGHWYLLNKMRVLALQLMEGLSQKNVEAIIHGSLARGDVNAKSDIDVFVPEVVSSYAIELSILDAGFRICRRELTQATPAHTLKAIIYIDDKTKVAFPLLPLRGRERQFYRFGGELALAELRVGKRVPGVDKRLMLIVPADFGHYEFSIIGRSTEAAKIIGIDQEIVRERTRVLTRRDEVGRTGIYFKEELQDGWTFEERLRERASRDPSLRRLMQQRGAEFKY